jgi:Kef-type K+ transport system membrane component KefB
MGIVLGNVAWLLGIDLIAVLREGPRVFELVDQVLLGAPLDAVAVEIFGSERGPELTRIITGPAGGQVMQVAHTVDVFSRYGIIFMLFRVGLLTSLDEMREVGGDSLRVALLGVALPLVLGFAAAELLMPGMSLNSTLFVAATLGATSIGISAEVLKEKGRSQTREGRIILGAAVGDDVLGLIILAVVSGIVVSGSVRLLEVVEVIAVSGLFLAAAVFLGAYIVRGAARIMRRLDVVEAKMFTSYLFVMILAWAANLAGLATIIGAFAAGVILSEAHFKEYEQGEGRALTVRQLIMPLEVVLVPIFFILMGIQVKIEAFLNWPVVILAGGLLVAAIVGKLGSGLGAKRPADRLVIGIGMLPRGEVGLVFAAIGRTLGVIDDAIFSGIVLMVIVTTLIAPPWLGRAVERQIAREAGSATSSSTR